MYNILSHSAIYIYSIHANIINIILTNFELKYVILNNTNHFQATRPRLNGRGCAPRASIGGHPRVQARRRDRRASRAGAGRGPHWTCHHVGCQGYGC